MRGLEGKGVLISGGSGGIGLAAARRFLEEGSRVFVGGLDAGEVAAAVNELGAAGGVAGDVSLEADVEALVSGAEAALGRIDVLINNAGIATKDAFVDITPEAWDRTLAVNLRGMFLVAQAAARSMLAHEPAGGTIVNMASTNALGGEDGFAHYNASKGGVLQLTRTMAVELGPRGIRVNCVCRRSVGRTRASGSHSAAPGAPTRWRPCTRSSRPTMPPSCTARRSWSTAASWR
jgi:NAD(P)-dependent dehydrogenase (short-subunit alcohol dehydrogenase family)